MFHASTSPLRPARLDISVPLLRTRTPFSVLQDRLCSVHAADALSRGGRRLCAVNVKLTMQLGIGVRLLVSARSGSRRFAPGAGEVVTGGVKQFGHRAGRGVAPGSRRGKANQAREGFLRALPSLFQRDFSDFRFCPPTSRPAWSGLKRPLDWVIVAQRI
jgi:hypothetical protein